jgi:hypothetical protein
MTSSATFLTVDSSTPAPLNADAFRFTGPSPARPQLVENEVRPKLFVGLDERRMDTSVGDLKLPTTFGIRWRSDLKPSASSKCEVLAEWNGCVAAVDDAGHSFTATLIGVSGEGVKGEEEEATIPVADVSEWDNDLLRPGNFFRLCVIYEILPSGQPRRYTQVVFRRLPAYRQHDLDRAMERGRELAVRLRVE